MSQMFQARKAHSGVLNAYLLTPWKATHFVLMGKRHGEDSTQAMYC